MVNDPNPTPILLYDGVCGFCDEWVQWVIRNDPMGRVRFAALQSERGRAFACDVGLSGAAIEEMQTVVLLVGDRVYLRSEAIRNLVLLLPYPAKALACFFVLPVSWNDFLYSWIAKHRYRIFGRRSECRVPSPEQRERFLE